MGSQLGAPSPPPSGPACHWPCAISSRDGKQHRSHHLSLRRFSGFSCRADCGPIQLPKQTQVGRRGKDTGRRPPEALLGYQSRRCLRFRWDVLKPWGVEAPQTESCVCWAVRFIRNPRLRAFCTATEGSPHIATQQGLADKSPQPTSPLRTSFVGQLLKSTSRAMWPGD